MENALALDEMVCFQAYTLHHAFGRHYQAAFAGTGLTYAKYVVLKALQEREKMSLTELSARLGVEPNTLSPLSRKMAGCGTIERVRDLEDERRIVLRLTPRGLDLLKQADVIAADKFAALGISAEETAQAVALMSRLRTALEGSVP